MKRIAYIIGIVLLFASIAYADKIEHYQYESCYWEVPVRKFPNVNAQLVFFLPKGVVVRVTEQYRYWIKITYRDENNDQWTGWAAATMMCPIDY